MKTKKMMRLSISILLVFAMLFTPLISGIGSNHVSAADDNILYQYFFKIGQADCFLIVLNGKTMLVDTGSYGTADTVKAFLDKKGITHLDYLVITHYDGDHIGGLTRVLGQEEGQKKITVGTFIARKYSSATLSIMYNKMPQNQSKYTQYRNYLKLINAIAVNGGESAVFSNISSIPYVIDNYPVDTTISKLNTLKDKMGTKYNWDFPTQGTEKTIYSATGNSLTATFLHKDTTYLSSKDEPASATTYDGNINNDSILFQLKHVSNGSTKKFLYVGDMGVSARSNLATYDANNSSFSRKSDVFKVAHHGFEHSTDSDLATAVNPSIAIVTNDDQCEIADNNYFTKLYETWNIANYVATANRNHDFIAIRLNSNGTSITKFAAYMDGTAQTLGVVPLN